jgi:hypothetical protein
MNCQIFEHICSLKCLEMPLQYFDKKNIFLILIHFYLNILINILVLVFKVAGETRPVIF